MSRTITHSRPVALITGAASGLGLDLARQLADRYQLVLVDVDETGLQRLRTRFADAHVIACDLANGNAIELALAELKNALPRLDLLINNAGITHRSLARVTRPEVIEKVMQIDYFAPVRLTSGLTELLRQSRGKVINISSMAGWMPVLGRAGYCAAKAALHQYFETFRAEMRPLGVGVLMVYPSFLDTPIEQNALGGDGEKTRRKRSMIGKMRSSEWMASLICRAIENGKERLFPDRFTAFSSLLYRMLPGLFLRLMTRKFAAELEASS